MKSQYIGVTTGDPGEPKLIKELVRREVVTIEDTKVHYKLSNEEP